MPADPGTTQRGGRTATMRVATVGVVLAALALAALAARSYRPFGGEAGGSDRSASSTFVDSLFTLAVVLLVGLAVIAISVRIGLVHAAARRGGRRSSFRGLIVYLAVIVVVVAAGRHVVDREKTLVKPVPAGEQAFPKGSGSKPAAVHRPVRSPQIVWPLAIGVAVLVGGTAAVLFVASRRRRSVGAQPRSQAVDELVAALDSAIDDLRRDPDPRRAVVAAYARMEQALAVFGLPRQPAEAPYEYLARAGRAIEAEESVAVLTELFEVAKFSEHAIDGGMRTRAINALVAVRTEVRAAA